jgi:hypothetical protein
MRSFSLVLLRRLLFRASPALGSKSSPSSRLTLYDRLSAQTLGAIERILLHSVLHEHVDSVRRKAVDTICDLANNSMGRGRPWHALQAQSFAMCKSADPSARECAFRIFSGCPNLVMDLQTDAVLRVLQEGLQDRQSVEVRLPLPLTPPSLQSILPIGPACSSSCFYILSHLFRSTPNCTVLIPHVPHAGHAPISPSRTLAQVPDHPNSSHDLPSSTLPAPPPSFALFPPRFDYTLSRLRTDPDCGEAFPGYTKLYFSTHFEWWPTRRRRARRGSRGGSQGRP